MDEVDASGHHITLRPKHPVAIALKLPASLKDALLAAAARGDRVAFRVIGNGSQVCL
jgi:hypothetical protein